MARTKNTAPPSIKTRVQCCLRGYIGTQKKLCSLIALLFRAISIMGRWVVDTLGQIGEGTRLLLAILYETPYLFRRWPSLAKQIYFLGNHSFVIISISALFVGSVLALQGYYTLNRYGSSEALGLLVALTLVRELGPVVSALLFAGRAGTGLTAEIGLMNAGEQISALDMMGIKSVAFVLVPRFWAGVFALPLLCALFSAIGIFGGYLVGVILLGVDSGAFWSQMQGGVQLGADIGNGMLKSIVFGIAVTFTALYHGYTARPTPEGVARATTRTVVNASLAVLGLDFLLTALMFSV